MKLNESELKIMKKKLLNYCVAMMCNKSLRMRAAATTAAPIDMIHNNHHHQLSNVFLDFN